MSETFPRCRAAKRPLILKPRASGLRFLANEPFRLFFPAGLIVSILGVSLWPLFYAHGIDFHPGMVHARLMTLGFLGSFVIGFAGTAMPRMLSAPRLTVWELLALFASLITLTFYYITGRMFAGDVCFLVMTGSFVIAMAARWIFMRKEHPPLEFMFAFLGLALAICGAIILVRAAFVFPSMEVYRLGQLLCYQGFLLFPILGVGVFLIPRLLFQNPQDGKRPRRIWVYILTASALIASLILEAWGHVRVGMGLRVVAVLGFLLLNTAVFNRTRTPGTLAVALRVALFSIVAGLLCAAIWPQLRIGMEHIAFISGFGLLALTIATRVVLGHSGEGRLFFTKLRPLKWIIGLVLVAMGTRVVAEVIPKIMLSHHIYAAILWIIASVIWLWWLIRRLRTPDPDE
jgi:uncharacterized protein involved in response to NO